MVYISYTCNYNIEEHCVYDTQQLKWYVLITYVNWVIVAIICALTYLMPFMLMCVNEEIMCNFVNYSYIHIVRFHIYYVLLENLIID